MVLSFNGIMVSVYRCCRKSFWKDPW